MNIIQITKDQLEKALQGVVVVIQETADGQVLQHIPDMIEIVTSEIKSTVNTVKSYIEVSGDLECVF